MKILHVINDLDPGGAERILYKVERIVKMIIILLAYKKAVYCKF